MRSATKASATEYIKSEQFIHEDLIHQGKLLVDSLFDLWTKDKKIRPSVLLFPGDRIKDDKGVTINGVVAMELDKEPDHGKAIEQAIQRTGAYAFIYVVTLGRVVRVLLESPHGTAMWELQIVRSGDVDVLKDMGRLPKRDVLSLGYLWSKNQGKA